VTRLLVDTHALLWWLTDDAGPSGPAIVSGDARFGAYGVETRW
jgi:hypothetical protein